MSFCFALIHDVCAYPHYLGITSDSGLGSALLVVIFERVPISTLCSPSRIATVSMSRSIPIPARSRITTVIVAFGSTVNRLRLPWHGSEKSEHPPWWYRFDHAFPLIRQSSVTYRVWSEMFWIVNVHSTAELVEPADLALTTSQQRSSARRVPIRSVMSKNAFIIIGPNVSDQTPAALDSANTTASSSRLSASVLFG